MVRYLPSQAQNSQHWVLLLGGDTHFLFDVTFQGCAVENAQSVTNETEVKVSVPNCALPGNMRIVVEPNSGELTQGYKNYIFSGNDFNLALYVPTPVITSFFPTEAAVRKEITITGTDFETTVEANEVAFGESGFINPNNVTQNGNVQILTVTVPTDAEDGEIKVKAFGTTALSGQSNLFTRLDQTVSSFTPTTFTSLSEITITGTHFSTRLADNQVCFGTNCVDASSVNDEGTELKVISPVTNNERTGTLKVKIGSVQVNAPGTFTLRPIPPLVFTDFNPKEVQIGKEIVISGSGFNVSTEIGLTDSPSSDFFNRGYIAYPYEINEAGTEMKVRMTYTVLRTAEDMIRVLIRKCDYPAGCGENFYEKASKGGAYC